jgi:alpha-amylase
MGALADVIQKAQRSYKSGLFGSGAFAENHDLPRFASLTSDTAVRGFRGSGWAYADSHFRGSRMSLRSLSFTTASQSYTTVSDDVRLLLASVHPIFLGQEQGYTGGNDPFNREA